MPRVVKSQKVHPIRQAKGCRFTGKNLKNKPNFNLGKIDVNYYLISEYENI